MRDLIVLLFAALLSIAMALSVRYFHLPDGWPVAMLMLGEIATATLLFGFAHRVLTKQGESDE